MSVTRPTQTPFIRLPVWVLRHAEMTPTILAVYLALAERSLIDRKPPKGVGWVMDASGLGRSAVYGALATLREIGAMVDLDPETAFLPTDDPSTYADEVSMHTDDSSAHADRASTTENQETPRGSDVPPEDDGEPVRLAHLLADLVETNGARRPNVTKSWVTEIDRMIRLDERTPEIVEKAIRWCQQDSFWRGVILSPTSLRKNYEKIRHASLRAKQSGRRQLDPVGDLQTLTFDDTGALVQ